MIELGYIKLDLRPTQYITNPMSVKTKAFVSILLAVMTLGVVITNVVIPYFQNASAFSLHGALNKLFGGFFQKPLPSNNKHPHNVKNTSSSSNSIPSQTSSSLTPPPAIVPALCHIVNGSLPDPNCTPGATNPSITQNNIKNTICVSGYTKTVRPSVSYTAPLKRKLMHSYGFTDSPSNYELDHLISLEIGGHPTDVKNLFPEPGYGQYNFHIKDRFENYLHHQVCNGAMSLSEAQNEIATNWISSWTKAGQHRGGELEVNAKYCMTKTNTVKCYLTLQKQW